MEDLLTGEYLLYKSLCGIDFGVHLNLVFGRQGISSSLLATIEKKRIGMLSFAKDPELWHLSINDAWLLGVIESKHVVYLEVDKYAPTHDEAMKKIIQQSQVSRQEKNFFKNPLDWVWDLKNRRFRVTGRELCLLLELGYEPYRFGEVPVEQELIFLGLELRDTEKSKIASFEKFREIMQRWQRRGPLPLLQILAKANWFSEEAYQAARNQYVYQPQERSRPHTPY